MKEYDAVVIGSGCGMLVVDEAMAHGWKVALVDKGPLGGTCANLGCIPSKLLIYPADRVCEIQESGKLGITADILRIDFSSIMQRMRDNLRESLEHMSHGIRHTKGLGFYEGQGHFIDNYTIEVNGKQIKGKWIFIAAGSRPLIPPLKGLDTIDYLTNESVLQLTEKPESMIIIGGGYIAVEYGHFFAAMGTKVTIVEMTDRLVASEEPEIAALLQEELGKRMTVLIGTAAQEVTKTAAGIAVTVKDKAGKESRLTAETIMIAVGRRSNADLLGLDKAGVEVDERGYIKVNQLFETSKKNIIAVGDINGRQMFTHMANRQAATAAHNAVHEAKVETDLSTPPPHAVFSWPQIAGAGLTEAMARKSHKVLVGRATYYDTAKGQAMMEQKGFAKAIVEQETDKILGFHIIGPHAPTLIQEVINVMEVGGHVDHIRTTTHIHPALSELIPLTLSQFE